MAPFCRHMRAAGSGAGDGRMALWWRARGYNVHEVIVCGEMTSLNRPLLITQRRQLNAVAAENAQHEPQLFWFSANLALQCLYTSRESCEVGIFACARNEGAGRGRLRGWEEPPTPTQPFVLVCAIDGAVRPRQWQAEAEAVAGEHTNTQTFSWNTASPITISQYYSDHPALRLELGE